jgi:hypothetical protein
MFFFSFKRNTLAYYNADVVDVNTGSNPTTSEFTYKDNARVMVG